MVMGTSSPVDTSFSLPWLRGLIDEIGESANRWRANQFTHPPLVSLLLSPCFTILRDEVSFLYLFRSCAICASLELTVMRPSTAEHPQRTSLAAFDSSPQASRMVREGNSHYVESFTTSILVAACWRARHRKCLISFSPYQQPFGYYHEISCSLSWSADCDFSCGTNSLISDGWALTRLNRNRSWNIYHRCDIRPRGCVTNVLRRESFKVSMTKKLYVTTAVSVW